MNMMELIVVEEVGDSLVLRLKQWEPGHGCAVRRLSGHGSDRNLARTRLAIKNNGEGRRPGRAQLQPRRRYIHHFGQDRSR